MFSRRTRILLAGFQGLLSLNAQQWDTTLILPGCESLAAEENYIWVFSYDRRAAIEDTPTPVQGHLFRFNGQESIPFLREVTPPEEKWHPFGLAYAGGYVWFTHAPKARPTEIWRYRWTGEKLESPRVWRHRDFVSLQAVCPTDAERFYTINDRKGANQWHLIAGFLVRRVRSSLFLCEGDSCRKVADHIPYAAGLGYLPAQQQLLVSVAFRKAIWLYQETGTPTQLKYIRKIRLPGYPDNITVLHDSLVWVVCHRRLMAWARSLAFGGQRSRWLIVEVHIPPTSKPQTRILYKAPKGYATASAALPIGKYIYVGSVFEPHLLRLRAAETLPLDALPASIDASPESRQP